MDKGGGHLHCILNILRIRRWAQQRRLRRRYDRMAITLKAGQEIASAGPGAGGEPLSSWLGRRQRLRKPLENAWRRVDESVRSA